MTVFKHTAQTLNSYQSYFLLVDFSKIFKINGNILHDKKVDDDT